MAALCTVVQEVFERPDCSIFHSVHYYLGDERRTPWRFWFAETTTKA
jgi:hypothetical protein